MDVPEWMKDDTWELIEKRKTPKQVVLLYPENRRETKKTYNSLDKDIKRKQQFVPALSGCSFTYCVLYFLVFF